MTQAKGTVSRAWRYVGIDVPADIIEPYRVKLSQLLSEEEFSKLEAQKVLRDGEEWHITLLVYKEYRTLTPEEKALFLIGENIEYKITGIGKAIGTGKVSGEQTVSYFATVEIPALTGVRESLGLDEIEHRDFHITLGFDPEDIHNADKSAKSHIWSE